MTLARFRSLLYLIARLLGDLNAVRRGTIGERIWSGPAITITGARPFQASATPVARLMVPGPEVVMHAAGFPEARE